MSVKIWISCMLQRKSPTKNRIKFLQLLLHKPPTLKLIKIPLTRSAFSSVFTNGFNSVDSTDVRQSMKIQNCVEYLLTLKLDPLILFSWLLGLLSRGHTKETGNRNATATFEIYYQPEMNTCYWLEQRIFEETAPFSDLCSTQADNKSRKLRLAVSLVCTRP
jgi:hypothetical protein